METWHEKHKYHKVEYHVSRYLSNSLVVVLNSFYFHPYLEKISNLTNIFEMGWNHQPVMGVCSIFQGLGCLKSNTAAIQ